MPRDAGGNYTLPAGNPVVGGTVITANWANPTMEDIGNELTQSLDRSGRGGMLVPFQNADGSVGSPGITWTNEPTSGFLRFGVGEMRASILGVDTTRWIDASGQTVGEQKPFEIWDGAAWAPPLVSGGVLLAPDGTALLPGIAYADLPATGMMRFTPGGELGWSLGGSTQMILGGSQSILAVGTNGARGVVTYETADPNGSLILTPTLFEVNNIAGAFNVKTTNARINLQALSGSGLVRGFNFRSGAGGGTERGSIIAPDAGSGVDISFLVGSTPASNTALVLLNAGNVVRMASLQGAGSRQVFADASGNLSAP